MDRNNFIKVLLVIIALGLVYGIIFSWRNLDINMKEFPFLSILFYGILIGLGIIILYFPVWTNKKLTKIPSLVKFLIKITGLREGVEQIEWTKEKIWNIVEENNYNYYSIILFDESIKGIYCNGCVYPYILSITQEKDYYRIRMCNIRAEMLINIKYIDKEEAYYAFMTLITYTNEKMRMKLTDIICSVNHSYTKDPYKEVHTYLDKKYGKEALTKQDIAPLFINNKAICWIKKNDNNYLYFKFKDEKIYDYCNKIMNIKKL